MNVADTGCENHELVFVLEGAASYFAIYLVLF